MKLNYIILQLCLVLATTACGDDAKPVGAVDALGDTAGDTSTIADVASEVGSEDTSADVARDVAADVTSSEVGEVVEPLEPLPGEPGPWNVGYRSETITYAPADGSPNRSLRLAYWYPTDATTGEEVLYGGLLPADNVLGDAPMASLESGAPVVVFSHGNSGFAEQSYFLTAFLASHGFVVVAPDHTGNTFADRNPPPDIFHWRPLDISAVLDHVDVLASPHFLAEALGTGRAVAGHSFGGYTALALTGASWDVDRVFGLCAVEDLPLGACDVLEANETLYRGGFLDARFVASIPMSPGAAVVFGAHGVADVAIPTLLFTGTLDGTTPNATDGDPIWGELATRDQNIRVNFLTGAHFTFSNACELPLDAFSEDGCGERFVDPDEAHTVLNALSLAFLNRHIFGATEGSDLLNGTLLLSGDTEITLGVSE